MTIRNSKAGLAVLVAVLVTGAVASASASAAEWRVGGSPLVGSAELSPTVTTSSNWTFTRQGIIVSCVTMSVQEGLIASPASGSAKALVFSGCSSTGSHVCTAPKEIKTKPLTLAASLGATSPKDTLKLTPASGTTFMEFTYSGEECEGALVQIKGKATVELPTGQEQKTEQELVANTPTGELGGAANVVWKGAGKLKLKSAKAFSFS